MPETKLGLRIKSTPSFENNGSAVYVNPGLYVASREFVAQVREWAADAGYTGGDPEKLADLIIQNR